MRVFAATLLLCLLPFSAVAQPVGDDRYPSWDNRMTGYVAVREPRWDVGGVSGGHGVLASWYGPGFHGRRTASGAKFGQDGLTFAHRKLPFGTRVRFHHRGRSAVCIANDRGPAAWTGREYDLSRGCARAIGMTGVARVGTQRI